VLVKRGESEGGGWALGIREGTAQNPIKLEDGRESDDGSDDSDSETDSGSDSDSEIQPIDS
jgi:DNA excision repair protein ERCC-5